MRVVTVIASSERGGAEIHVEHLVRFMTGVDHAVVPFAKGPLIERWRSAGAEIAPFVFPGKWRRGVVDRLAEHLKTLRPDVVHCHQPKANFYGTLAARRMGAKAVVATIHGSHRQFSYSRGRLWTRVYAELDRRTARAADRAIAVCGETRADLVKQGIDPQKVTVIPNGIPDPGWTQSLPESSEGITAGFMGRFSREKGVGLLASVMASSSTGISRWVVAGSGPERSAWERRRKGFSLPVEDLGWIDDEEIFFRKIHLLVVPSLSEGASLTILGALARGIPVVATGVGGNPELVGQKDDPLCGGILVPPKPDALLLALSRLAQDQEMMMSCSFGGRKRYEKHFAVERMAERTRSLYQEILDA